VWNDDLRHIVVQPLMHTVHATMRNEGLRPLQNIQLRRVPAHEKIRRDGSELATVRALTRRQDKARGIVPERLECGVIKRWVSVADRAKGDIDHRAVAYLAEWEVGSEIARARSGINARPDEAKQLVDEAVGRMKLARSKDEVEVAVFGDSANDILPIAP